MTDPRDRPSYIHDTEPGGFPAIDDAVVERYRRDSSAPAATAKDVRNAMLEALAGPDREVCATCGGLGEVSPERARALRAIASTMLPPPPPMSEGELEPTICVDEPTSPER